MTILDVREIIESCENKEIIRFDDTENRHPNSGEEDSVTPVISLIARLANSISKISDYFAEEIADVIPIKNLSKLSHIILVMLSKIKNKEIAIEFYQILSNIVGHESNRYANEAIENGLFGLLEEYGSAYDEGFLQETFRNLTNLVKDNPMDTIERGNFIETAVNLIEKPYTSIEIMNDAVNFLNEASFAYPSLTIPILEKLSTYEGVLDRLKGEAIELRRVSQMCNFSLHLLHTNFLFWWITWSNIK